MSPFLVAVLLVVHLLSGLLALPLGFSQYHLDNVLVFLFSIVLFFFHLFNFFVFTLYRGAGAFVMVEADSEGSNGGGGKKNEAGFPSDLSYNTCLLRRALQVYLLQCVYWFLAFLCLRVWMIAAGRIRKVKQDMRRMEWYWCTIAVLVPAIPTLLVSVPQMVHSTQDLKPMPNYDLLFTCENAYRVPWQIYVEYPVFTSLPALLTIFTQLALLFTVIRLLAKVALKPSQKSALLVLVGRVALMNTVVVSHEVYTIYDALMRSYSSVNPTLREEKAVDDVLVALLGTFVFLVFATTKRSSRHHHQHHHMVPGGIPSAHVYG